MLAVLHLALALVQPLQSIRKTIPFPQRVLAEFLAGDNKPGSRIDSPVFECGGSSWQLALYPLGASADPYYANRVALYLKLLQPESARKVEVDATFELTLRCLPAAAATTEHSDASQRGAAFKCGMTMCTEAEAGSSVGRCEDWGAHVYPSQQLLRELELGGGETQAVVDVALDVWATRECRSGASLGALLEQVNRLPRGALRVGEIVVALRGGEDSEGGAGGEDGDGYRPVEGVEYRVMRLVAADGQP